MKTIHLATLDNSVQASMVKDVLANEGIECFLKNETMGTVMNIPGFQVEIEVSENDYEKALRLLREGFPELGY